MEIFTVSLFGHREIDDLRGLERKLSRWIEELLRRHEYVTIFIFTIAQTHKRALVYYNIII